jgi:hypothetical protein
MGSYLATISGDDLYPSEDDAQIYSGEPIDVTVTYPGEEGVSEWTCGKCGETTQDDPADVGSGSLCESAECEACDGVGQIWPEGTTDYQNTESKDCEACATTGHGAHDWQADAHDWVNSAGISTTEDSVSVRISVGDPRGAFVMSVTRGDDGELRLSLPSPADGMAHMGLVPLSPGYFRIVPSESPEHVKARREANATATSEEN